MLGINGNRVWCRTTEEKILQAFCDGVSKKISIRDRIENVSDSVFSKTKYILWNTTLVKKFEDDVYIYIASNMEERDRYWKPNPYNNWTPKDYIISNTTKSRLNAFLDYYGFNSLEVHSSKKDWSVKHNGKELDLDCWYKLDFSTKELIKE
jgi:hypothetical protein